MLDISKLDRAKGVTAETFEEKAKTFMEIRQEVHGADYGHMLSRDEHGPQWKAWSSYRQSKGLKTVHMARVDEFMVPAEWPHQFDADWPPEQDERWAGFEFPESNFVEESESVRKGVVLDWKRKRQEFFKKRGTKE